MLIPKITIAGHTTQIKNRWYQFMKPFLKKIGIKESLEDETC